VALKSYQGTLDPIYTTKDKLRIVSSTMSQKSNSGAIPDGMGLKLADEDGREFKKRRLDVGPSAFSPPNYSSYFVSVPLNDHHHHMQHQPQDNFHPPHYNMSIPQYHNNGEIPHYSHEDGPLPSISSNNYADSFPNGLKMPYLPQFNGYQNHPQPHDHIRESQHNGYITNSSGIQPTADHASTSVKPESKPGNKAQLPPNNPTNFYLVEQPQEKQRKAYQNENRHLLPHPLRIQYSGKASDIIEGRVTARLLIMTRNESGKGENFVTEPAGEGILGGEISMPLETKDTCQAAFALNIYKTTGSKSKYLLEFTVRYLFKGETFYKEDVIRSNPFIVASNKVKSLDRPLILGIMPKSLVTGGPQNEVWIRGRKFLKNKKNLVVKFGNISATIVQCETNLIIVQPPIIEDLTKELTVQVEISNVLDDQAVPAKENLTFTFLPNHSGKNYDSFSFQFSE
jgi:hypothetical protein